MAPKKRSAPRKGAAKKTKRAGGKVTIPAKGGNKAITFQKGGLHRSLGVPQGQKIPPGKMAAAKAGKYGPKAKKQANLATGLAKMRKGR